MYNIFHVSFKLQKKSNKLFTKVIEGNKLSKNPNLFIFLLKGLR